jgi:hypothetical protein
MRRRRLHLLVGNGINNRGEIAGLAVDIGNGEVHGYVARPQGGVDSEHGIERLFSADDVRRVLAQLRPLSQHGVRFAAPARGLSLRLEANGSRRDVVQIAKLVLTVSRFTRPFERDLMGEYYRLSFLNLWTSVATTFMPSDTLLPSGRNTRLINKEFR